MCLAETEMEIGYLELEADRFLCAGKGVRRGRVPPHHRWALRGGGHAQGARGLQHSKVVAVILRQKLLVTTLSWCATNIFLE